MRFTKSFSLPFLREAHAPGSGLDTVVTPLAPLSLAAATGRQNGQEGQKVLLAQNWILQSSCKLNATGEQISAPAFKAEGWHHARVPSTVLAALVADKTFPDPYFAMNLRSIAGTTYPIATNLTISPRRRTAHSSAPGGIGPNFHCRYSSKRKTSGFILRGLTIAPTSGLNGSRIADSEEVAGAYREFEFQINGALKSGQKNVLAIETFAPEPKDLAINWVDWNPMPPDKDMGLWKDVSLTASGPRDCTTCVCNQQSRYRPLQG